MKDGPSLVTTPWLTIPQAADVAQCSEKQIARAIRSGRLACTHLNGGRFIRIHVDDVHAWLRSYRTAGPVAVADRRSA